MTIEQAQDEIRQAWTDSYSPAAIGGAVRALAEKPLWLQISMFVGRFIFRGIYFPQMGRSAWMKDALRNRTTIFRLVRLGFAARRSNLSTLGSKAVSKAKSSSATAALILSAVGFLLA